MTAGGLAAKPAILVITLGKHHVTRLGVNIPMLAPIHCLFVLLHVFGLGVCWH